MYTLFSEMQHQREAALTKILRTQEKRFAVHKAKKKSFPVLQRFGIPIDDARVHKNIFQELF